MREPSEKRVSLPKVSKSRVHKSSSHEHTSLSKIFSDPNSFISGYFADIHSKLK